ncbi:MAG: anaerobic ribonucleoside-triphosphate reductase activating protein [Lachnospiraceae bacterium]|nr:anaerobic ribonucleoside-triphosphate reductase activating protein [Lachnospiraceae bacterium]MEE0960769.1 anaerobic ribonucleoside-triphosphate reductase activating protein [Lachnospiraceae bacterium]
MNYADIKQFDIANGPGVRVSLFVSGCYHHCKNCFNEETWDFNYGSPYTKETEDRIIEYMKPDYVEGITLLGGDPFALPNQKPLVELLKRIREIYPCKTIWCFTGYLYDKEILEDMAIDHEETMELLNLIDVLVDGRFVESLKNVKLRFKGSSNQRTILVKESLEKGEIVLWDPNTR